MKISIPYRVKQFYRKLFPVKKKDGWFGNYSSWKDAENMCTGYDASNILEKVKTSVLKVKNGEAAYERDSVLFEEIEYSALLSEALDRIATEKQGTLLLIDFGGSLGSSYFQNRSKLSGLNELKWNVVEQKHFVDCGKQFIQDERLKFNYTIEEALNENKADVLLLASVIQYFEKPYELIEKCLSYGFEYIIVDRTGFLEAHDERITVQKVPEFVYNASYPAWFLNEKKFRSAFEKKYELIGHKYSEASNAILLDDKVKAYWKGFFYKKRNA